MLNLPASNQWLWEETKLLSSILSRMYFLSSVIPMATTNLQIVVFSIFWCSNCCNRGKGKKYQGLDAVAALF
jgi:hypothetical protein